MTGAIRDFTVGTPGVAIGHRGFMRFYIPQGCVAEVDYQKVGLRNVSSGEIRSRKINASKPGSSKVCICEVDVTQIGANKLYAAQVRRQI